MERSKIIQGIHFNPRSYKRSDIQTVTYKPQLDDFNPRSYKRSDCTGGEGFKIRIFQSTLLQEERRNQKRTEYVCFDFNPRSYKRSDYMVLSTDFRQMISIHAPTRGATLVGLF